MYDLFIFQKDFILIFLGI